MAIMYRRAKIILQKEKKKPQEKAHERGGSRALNQQCSEWFKPKEIFMSSAPHTSQNQSIMEKC